MVSSFLDKVSGYLDQRFVVAYWSPAFVGVALAMSLWAMRVGLTASGAWWDARGGTQQVMIGIAVLIVVTVIAYLLQAIDTPLVRLYEGYWPPWLAWLQRLRRNAHLRIKASMEARGKGTGEKDNSRDRYYAYPRENQYVRATRLGNAMTAAEAYPFTLYQIDPIVWWPRITAVLPPEIRIRVNGAFTPVVALLNLCTFFGLWALSGASFLALSEQGGWLTVSVIVGGLIAAWLCYRAAVTQAYSFGDQVRAAFDLYRHELLAKMHIPLPKSLAAERLLWFKLGQLHYANIFPWELKLTETDTQLPDDPFNYDSTNKNPTVFVQLQVED